MRQSITVRSIVDLHMLVDHEVLCPGSNPSSNRFGGRLFSGEEPHEEKLDDVCVDEQKLCSSIALSAPLRVRCACSEGCII